MPEVVVAFRGPVSCQRSPGAPVLTLVGRAGEPVAAGTMLSFSATAPAGCPDVLEDAVVERLGAGHYRLRAGTREWLIGARAVHLHREAAAEFYRAIPPRRAPWGKRLFWRMVLALARSRAGLGLLKLLRS
ncbi:MAG: hypothetical protein JO173_01515 [Gammaproteobacteria bacterium]|nr:hypothetical protein [Gammaproteobacteria bacterium]